MSVLNLPMRTARVPPWWMFSSRRGRQREGWGEGTRAADSWPTAPSAASPPYSTASSSTLSSSETNVPLWSTHWSKINEDIGSPGYGTLFIIIEWDVKNIWKKIKMQNIGKLKNIYITNRHTTMKHVVVIL